MPHVPDLIPVDPEFARTAHIDAERYAKDYARSITDPEGYWAEQAEQFVWHTKWSRVCSSDFSGDVRISWFEGGMCNIAENCLDRHLGERGDKIAIIWEPDDPKGAPRTYTYRELHTEVCKLSNILEGQGVKAGDRVSIYLPMIPEAAIAMLACARIGAVHSVVFGGFSADALRGRIEDSESVLLITADEGRRGGKKVPLKENADKAIFGHTPIKKMLVVKHTGGQVNLQEGRDVWWHEVMQDASAEHKPLAIGAEAPLFILYTSGSTGKPKGILHATGGYMVYAAHTHKLIFNVKEDDVYWCTADVGWVTGHSYIVYGPLLNGATTLMFEGVPNHPDHSRFWNIIDKHKVTLFYTAPTAIRALMREGDEWVKRTSRATLRLLASVGEPINPEAWRWYYETVGDSRCPVVDTWWQTETGGIMIAPLAGAMDLKPGSAMQPFFGVQPVMLDAQTGKVVEGEGAGVLAIAASWPGQAVSIHGDHARFRETYFSQYPGYYFTGDGCRRDTGGDWWITGRVDDVLNVSGHRIGTAEVESALVAHEKVAEAAVVGAPHDIKGQGIYAFVMLNSGIEMSEALVKELKAEVRSAIGPIATPDFLQVVPSLPKTRSGKIMRRILRKIAENDFGQLGDISTLLNPEVVDIIITQRLNR